MTVESEAERAERVKWLRKNVRRVGTCEKCGGEIDVRTGQPIDNAFWRDWAKREHRWVHRLEDEIARLRK